jgi:hypothetical protein
MEVNSRENHGRTLCLVEIEKGPSLDDDNDNLPLKNGDVP